MCCEFRKVFLLSNENFEVALFIVALYECGIINFRWIFISLYIMQYGWNGGYLFESFRKYASTALEFSSAIFLSVNTVFILNNGRFNFPDGITCMTEKSPLLFPSSNSHFICDIEYITYYLTELPRKIRTQTRQIFR